MKILHKLFVRLISALINTFCREWMCLAMVSFVMRCWFSVHWRRREISRSNVLRIPFILITFAIILYTYVKYLLAWQQSMRRLWAPPIECVFWREDSDGTLDLFVRRSITTMMRLDGIDDWLWKKYIYWILAQLPQDCSQSESALILVQSRAHRSSQRPFHILNEMNTTSFGLR